MKRSPRFSAKVWSLAAGQALIFVALAGVIVWNAGEFSRLQSLQIEARSGEAQAQSLQLLVSQLWQFTTDASLTRDEAALKDQAGGAFRDAMRISERMLNDDEGQDQAAVEVREFRARLDTFWKIGQGMVEAYGLGQDAGDEQMTRFDAAGARLLEILQRLADRAGVALEARDREVGVALGALAAGVGGLVLLGLFLALLTGVLLGTRYRRPLAALDSALTRLRETGPLEVQPIDHHAEDELGRAAASFDLYLAAEKDRERTLVADSSSARMSVERADRLLTSLAEGLQTVGADLDKILETRETGQQIIESYVDTFSDVRRDLAESIRQTEVQNEAVIAGTGTVLVIVERLADHSIALQDQLSEGDALRGGALEAQHSQGRLLTTVAHAAEAAQRLAKLTQVLEDLSQKTSMLALNAAIEASRAGGQGRGFAVVADEVRRFSDQVLAQSTQLSGEVKQLTEALDASLAEGDSVTEAFDTLLHSLGTHLGALGHLSDELTVTTREATAMGSQLHELTNSTQKLQVATQGVAMGTAGIETALTGLADLLRAGNQDYREIQRLLDDVRKDFEDLRSAVTLGRSNQTLVEARLRSIARS